MPDSHWLSFVDVVDRFPHERRGVNSFVGIAAAAMRRRWSMTTVAAVKAWAAQIFESVRRRRYRLAGFMFFICSI
jgi:hypothetical protein